MEKPPTPEEAEQRRELHRQNTRMANEDSQFGVNWETGRNETEPRAADNARAALEKARRTQEPVAEIEQERPDLTVHEENGGGVHLTPTELRKRANKRKAKQVRNLRQNIAQPDQEAS